MLLAIDVGNTETVVGLFADDIGEPLAALGGLRVHECPFPISQFSVKQHWHARYHHDTANRWLRGLCAGLFHQGFGVEAS